MSNVFSLPIHTAFDTAGVTISGAKLNFYQTSTSTRQDTFSDSALSSANANPVVANSAGRFGAIFLKDAQYKVVLTDASDVEIWTFDPVVPQTRVVDDTSPVAGGTFSMGSFAFNEAKASDIATAATTDIGAAAGNYVELTGTATITGLGTIAAGTRRITRTTGACTFTYNATSLILPTNANIVAAAGDIQHWISLGSGNWLCTAYQRDTGVPILAAATQAQMETATATDVHVTPGRTQYHPGVAKAWLMFEQIGTQSILASHNITSIADGGAAGDTDITIATDFSSANYGLSGMAGQGAAGTGSRVLTLVDADPTAGAISIECRTAADTTRDTEFVSISMFGDQ